MFNNEYDLPELPGAAHAAVVPSLVKTVSAAPIVKGSNILVAYQLIYHLQQQ
jgi:hypothetical protein